MPALADLPAARRCLSRLVEDTAVCARVRNGLGDPEPAPFGSLALADRLHDVVPAVLFDAHLGNDRALSRAGRPEPSPGVRVGRVEEVPASTSELLRWGETLSAIARTGLAFTQNLFDSERYQEILNVAGDIRAAGALALQAQGQPVTTPSDAAGLVLEWMQGVRQGVPGYVTPKVAIGAIVGNEKGEILLIKRADSGVWLYPTGWADVGYSAAEVAVKDTRGDGDRSRAGTPCHGPRRPPTGFHPGSPVLARFPPPVPRRGAETSSA